MSEKRVSMLEERAAHANYLLLPTTFSFPKVVRICSFVFSFVSKCRRGRIVLSRLLCEGKLWFSMFHSRIEDQETGLMLSSVSMVTSTQTDNPDRGVCMVSQFSTDIFMTDEQKKSFSATLVQDLEG